MIILINKSAKEEVLLVMILIDKQIIKTIQKHLMIIFKQWQNKDIWLMYHKDQWVNKTICFKNNKCHNKGTNHKCLIKDIRTIICHNKNRCYNQDK